MLKQIRINILRAFVDEEGKFGNQTGIIVDETQSIFKNDRQKIATKLNFTETVFINNLKTFEVNLFNPQQETKFGGDALISTSYFINHILGKKTDFIICKGGRVKTWEKDEFTWIESILEGTPGWIHKQLENSKAVKNITLEEAKKFKHTMVWAWENEEKGLIKSRTFLPDWGTLEDFGNGSGSMQLAKILNRKIEIHQGKGSIIYSSPTGKDSAGVGGRVKFDKSIIIENR